jgi:hypothetical protein
MRNIVGEQLELRETANRNVKKIEENWLKRQLLERWCAAHKKGRTLVLPFASLTAYA